MQRLKNWKRKHLKQKNNNIKEANGIQMNFVFEIKFKRYICFAKYDCYFGDLYLHSKPQFKWECDFLLTVKSHNKKQAIEIQVTFIIEKKLQKVHFLAKKHCLLGKLCVHFEPLLGWQITYVCHD